ncbi:unnamed protein product, partial [Didymodactylos carnosus]
MNICPDMNNVELVYATFLEMNRFLQNNIKTEITEKAEYQIICLKQHLIQIYQKINELNQKHLNPEDYEFTIDFGTEIIEWLYQTIL